MTDLSDHGGYLGDPTGHYVIYRGQNVPYWMFEGSLNIPNIESGFREGLLAYIQYNKDGLASSLDKNVEFGAVEISGVRLLDNEIEVDVNMPTVLHMGGNTYPLEMPYSCRS